ncbi:hypothetical protein K435DRAFT_810024 [Dendrothele bispora CBS 962.96]|uniref:Uncharacterized protein n=1 Tax=Dendrothele bispora (strain CBS 962.96) TaxID=1314807 RepID=A0A4S8KWC2_DENBC|nr:hypothetical protein K435DRAFT_810024 [Dendrothele bispora CBS 962.96]
MSDVRTFPTLLIHFFILALDLKLRWPRMRNNASKHGAFWNEKGSGKIQVLEGQFGKLESKICGMPKGTSKHLSCYFFLTLSKNLTILAEIQFTANIGQHLIVNMTEHALRAKRAGNKDTTIIISVASHSLIMSRGKISNRFSEPVGLLVDCHLAQK